MACLIPRVSLAWSNQGKATTRLGMARPGKLRRANTANQVCFHSRAWPRFRVKEACHYLTTFVCAFACQCYKQSWKYRGNWHFVDLQPFFVAAMGPFTNVIGMLESCLPGIVKQQMAERSAELSSINIVEIVLPLLCLFFNVWGRVENWEKKSHPRKRHPYGD